MRDFNFFLPYLNDKKEQKNKKVYLTATLVVFGAIIIGSFMYNTIYIYMLKSDIAKLSATYESDENREKLSQAVILNKTFEVVNSYNKEMETVFENIQECNNINSNILYSVSNSIPKEVSFTSMVVEANTLQIQGVSKNRVAVAELEYNLKKINFMEEVHVGNLSLEGTVAEGEYGFSIKCTLKGVLDDEAK